MTPSEREEIREIALKEHPACIEDIDNCSIYRAILTQVEKARAEERERCSLVAESFRTLTGQADNIASAIRSNPQQTREGVSMKKILAIAFIATVFQGCISVTPYSAIDMEKTDLCHDPIRLEVCAGKSTAYVGDSGLVLEPYDCYTIPYYKLSEITTSTKPLKVSGEATVRIARNKSKT